MKKTFANLEELDEFVGNDCGHEIDLGDVKHIRDSIEIARNYEEAFGVEPIKVTFTYDWSIKIKATYMVNNKKKVVEFEP